MTESLQSGALTELILEEDKVHKSLVPDDVVIRDYLSCINDDTWVRHADLVQIETLKETPQGEEVKQEVLRTYIDERLTKGTQRPPDPILEGIYWQEKFMEEYKKGQRTVDKADAGNYKQTLLSSFRSKRPNPRITSGQTQSHPTNNAIEYRPEPTSAETPKAPTKLENEVKLASPKAAAAPAAEMYPTDGAAATEERRNSGVPPNNAEAAYHEIGETETHNSAAAPNNAEAAYHEIGETETHNSAAAAPPNNAEAAYHEIGETEAHETYHTDVKPPAEPAAAQPAANVDSNKPHDADQAQFELELGDPAEKPAEDPAVDEDAMQEM